MNKDKMKGFLCGVLASATVLGLGGTARALSKTITVDDGIAVTVNGVSFTPRDANGNQVPVFVYNGTTYAPIRAFANAAGLMVDYDASTRTAELKTPDYAASVDPDASSYATAEQAKAAALKDAGVSASDALFLKASLDWENGRAVYEVEFCSGNMEYDYELDAVTCQVLEKDFDCEDYDWDRQTNSGGGQQSGSSTRITADEAKAAALARLPGGTVRQCELDKEDGRWVYELELRKGNQEYECVVDAATGEILVWQRDD